MTDVTMTGVCVYCGTERPFDVVRCPSCGRPWPDHRLTNLDPTVLEAPEESGHSRLLDDPGTGPPPRWWIPAAVAALVLAAIFVVPLVFASDESPSNTTVAGSAQTPLDTVGGTAATDTTPAPATTAPPPTTATPPTTAVTTTTLAPIEPVGDPIPLDDLSLGAFALGPLRFGDPGDTTLGRLVATLGQPTGREEVTEAWGTCPGDIGTVHRFDGLAVILVQQGDEEGAELFAGYRVNAVNGDDIGDSLETISGVRLGMSFADVEAAYPAPITEQIDIDGAPHYVVLRSSDRRTLLWGPLSGTGQDATVTGIYSPRPCDQGPGA